MAGRAPPDERGAWIFDVGARRAEPDGTPSERAFQSAANDMPDYEAAARSSRRPFDPLAAMCAARAARQKCHAEDQKKTKGGDVAVWLHRARDAVYVSLCVP